MLYVSKQPIVCGKFPNSETYVDYDFIKDIPIDSHVEITMRYQGNDDIVNLILLKGMLDDMGFSSVSLKSPFFPYETMDRSENVRSLSVKYISKIINSMNFTSVEIWEPHSDVVLAILDRVNSVDKSANIAKSIIRDNKNALIVFLDSGAAKRYKNNFKNFNTAVMSKHRNFNTGNLVCDGFIGKTPEIKKNTQVVIVDDLCRKGGTFVLASEYLKAWGARNIEIVVTHCENTVQNGSIPEAVKNGLIKAIHTTDSILTLPAPWTKIVETII